jgi:Domain of unknown function
LDDETRKTEANIQQYKAIIDFKESTTATDLNEVELKRILKALVFERQYLVYLDAIRQQSIESRNLLVQFNTKYEEIMTDIFNACKSKSAVPVDHVYPLFTKVATRWTSLFDLLSRISFQKGIADKLVEHRKSFHASISALLINSSQPFFADIEPKIQSDEDIIKNAIEAISITALVNRKVEVLHPGNTTQYYHLPVEFGGFCAWTLVNKDGLVVPGDKNCGIFKYKDKIFVFSDLEKAIDFLKAADEYFSSLTLAILKK